MIDFILELAKSDSASVFFTVIYYGLWVLVPLVLIYMAWTLWVHHVRAQFFAKQKYILLEIKLPREILKSPQAMEFFINNLHQTGGEGNWHEKYWKGQVRPWFSLEIASFNGGVHFFVWGRSNFKNLIESNLYSQFPGIEIYEVEDYTLSAHYDPEVYTVWSTEFDLTKPDAYPIKTYLDYELEKNPDEEFKIDPLTPLIEFLGSVPRNQQVWFQILVRAHKEEDRDPATGKMIDARWAKAAQKEIDDIITKVKGEKGADGKIVPGTGRQLTDVERETINALARSVSKKGFDVGMRVVYIAPKDEFNPGNIGGIFGAINHFGSNLNGFKPARGSADKHSHTLLVWKERSMKTRHEEKEALLHSYKKRAYFHHPEKSPHFILNSEELATLFHFPGGVSATPSFTRIESKKAEAPTNLPI